MGGEEKGKRKRYNDGLQVMTPWPVIELARQCHDPRQLLALQKFQARAAAGTHVADLALRSPFFGAGGRVTATDNGGALVLRCCHNCVKHTLAP